MLSWVDIFDKDNLFSLSLFSFIDVGGVSPPA